MRVVATYGLLFFLSTLASAQSTTESEAEIGKIKAKIEASFPDIKVDSVAPAQWSGLYEVVTNGQLAYTNKDASLLFAGKIIDTATKEDLTTKRWSELHAIEFNSLPFDAAIKIVRGSGNRKLAIFADPDCPYCERLEHVLQDFDDVTIFVFLYPLEDIHPGARARAERLWCATDRAEAWRNWMLRKIEPAAQKCSESPIEKIASLGQNLNVSGTPTLFFADGFRIGGLPTAEQIAAALKTHEKKPQS